MLPRLPGARLRAARVPVGPELERRPAQLPERWAPPEPRGRLQQDQLTPPALCPPTVVSCLDPGQVDNGRRVLSGPRFTAGATVQYVCNRGFRLSGNSLLSCVSRGASGPRWNQKLPRCLREYRLLRFYHQIGMVSKETIRQRFKAEKRRVPRGSKGSGVKSLCVLAFQPKPWSPAATPAPRPTASPAPASSASRPGRPSTTPACRDTSCWASRFSAASLATRPSGVGCHLSAKVRNCSHRDNHSPKEKKTL